MATHPIISPIDGQVVAEIPLLNPSQLLTAIDSATQSQKIWQALSLHQRADICRSAIDILLTQKEQLGEEITLQMGRPILYASGEINGLAERGRFMIEQAEASLVAIELPRCDHTHRFIQRQAVGNVAILAPWNYPYLTAINAVIPALLSGNSVLLKHSLQTALCGDRLQQAFTQAGLPKGILQSLHLDHTQAETLIQHPSVGSVVFTGSVGAGSQIEQTLAGKFKKLSLELGGKDAAYVRADAQLEFSVEQLVDGAFFNAGQSCCGIERIYVNKAVYQPFVDAFVEQTRRYQLGNPLQLNTTLGPVIHCRSADHIRQQIQQATASGAQALIGPHAFHCQKLADNYLAPQVLIDVDHSMSVMTEENFGPVVGIQQVSSDSEAIELINDSRYGLTASLWTQDTDAATRIGTQLQVGTVFMNRCDYLDPALAWSGRKQSGRGCALSQLGFEAFTHTQSFYLHRHDH